MPALGGGGRKIRVWGYTWLHREFGASLGHVRLCLKKKITETKPSSGGSTQEAEAGRSL